MATKTIDPVLSLRKRDRKQGEKEAEINALVVQLQNQINDYDLSVQVPVRMGNIAGLGSIRATCEQINVLYNELGLLRNLTLNLFKEKAVAASAPGRVRRTR